MVTSISFIVLFYGICIWALCCNGGYRTIFNVYTCLSKIQKCLVCMVLALLVIFASYYVCQNHFIYFWDNAGYWNSSINWASDMRQKPIVDIFKCIYNSINYDDYNIFLPTVIGAPLSVFGYKYTTYVIICFVMFLIPAVIVQGLLVVKMIPEGKWNKGWLYVCGVLLAVLFPNNYYAGLRGYIDIGFLVPMSASMYLFIDYDFRRVVVQRNVAISLTLILAWICRRYVIFFIIGYVVAMLIKAAFAYAQDQSKESLKAIFFNFLQIGLVSIVILTVAFTHFFFHALLTNYGAMYSAYDAPLKEKLQSLCTPFGILTLLIIVVAFFGIRNKAQRINFIALFGLLVATTLTFWQTQNMGVQHRMLLNLPIFLMCAMNLEYFRLADGKIGKHLIFNVIKRYFAMGVCGILMFYNFAKAYSPLLSTKGCGIYVAERYYPLRRDDISQLELLAEKLNDLTKDTENHIYVAASGGVLNCDLLRKLHLPDSADAIPNMYDTHDVDLRDGFPSTFISAEYVVTTDPIDTHLASGQEVVTYLAQEVMDTDSYIGCHFICIDQVELEYGVVAKIYKKQSPFSGEDLMRLKAYYADLYPGCDDIFAERILTAVQ